MCAGCGFAAAAGQSVALHLMSICVQLEHGRSSSYGRDLLRRAAGNGRDWPWLVQPTPIGTVTVDDVLNGRTTIAVWAQDVWRAWSSHHHSVQQWLDALVVNRARGGG